MKKKNNVIIQRITDPKKVQKVIKSSNGIIKPKTLELICKGANEMSKDIWTKDQQNYLDDKFDAIDKKFDAIDKKFDAIDKKFEAIDKKFEAVDQRFDKLEKSIDKRFDTIIQILARNGMR